ncbi:MAG: GDP-mannose 4,6-dehydratase [Polaromonas sp.]|nr:GDP-mannose 4,6-dehydratase [Polaromonas sp.]
MTILVTGLSGFVGAHICPLVNAVDLGGSGRFVDLRDPAGVRQAVSRLSPTAVIHLAGQSSIGGAIENPMETYEVNFIGTLNLLNALRDAGFQGRFLYVGSAEVYGVVPETELPVAENRTLQPQNPYAVSKVAAEALCYQWSQAGPFEIVMARPFNHIGPGQTTRFAVADFAQQITRARMGKRDRILQTGDVDTTRDFTDVRDIARAYVSLLESGVNGEIYNVCSGVEKSLREVIAMLCKTAGVEMHIEVMPERLRSSDRRRMRGSFERLHSRTDWRPQIPLEKTLQDILNYWHTRESE